MQITLSKKGFEITVHGQNKEPEKKTVYGYVCNQLPIGIRQVDDILDEKEVWELTHLGTGLRFPLKSFDRLKDVRAFLSDLAEAKINWNFDDAEAEWLKSEMLKFRDFVMEKYPHLRQ